MFLTVIQYSYFANFILFIEVLVDSKANGLMIYSEIAQASCCGTKCFYEMAAAEIKLCKCRT